jgi:hypothetical protein
MAGLEEEEKKQSKQQPMNHKCPQRKGFNDIFKKIT